MDVNVCFVGCWDLRIRDKGDVCSVYQYEEAMTSSLNLLFSLATILPAAIGTCDHLSLHFHKELGCKPVHTADPNCPEYFDCGGLEENRRNFCVIKQLFVEGGQRIEEHNEISSPCIPQCYCAQNFAVAPLTKYRWECTFSDCPHHFRPNLRPGCYWREELKGCCPKKQVCKKELAKCTYNGVTYKENDRFYTFRGSSCNKCVCGTSYNGTLSDNMCTEIGCDLELHDGEQLVRGCAPVYSRHFCCPLDWRCPDAGDTVEKNSVVDPTVVTAAKGPQCRFGNLLLNVGDKVLPDDESTCRCSIPPYVVCTSI
ncbi:uncharacterized protein LOC128989035 [Macrosteles quadrilineatus]|uniref:uncharacterized protein LOC128989035 n=1 Tax=Macrosteles quadrilineatus TaxID=74068 RepID=UPI0023E0E300|nr:uncharacterized protein LOC128989035 [Macrosteles quadrilineatus]